MASPTPPAPPRRRILGVSTKMYFSLARTRSYLEALGALLAADDSRHVLDRVDVFVCPDFVSLAGAVQQAAAACPRLQIGAQDCCGWAGPPALPDDYGAFTGCTSPAVLADVGARIVAVGHAERRRLLAETDATTAAKAAAAVRHGLVPLVCVGEGQVAGGSANHESADARAAAAAVIIVQVDAVLAAIPDDAPVLLAYEPIWAIGGAHPASAAYVRAVVASVRRGSVGIQRRIAAGHGAQTRILYGGSAGPGTFEQLAGGEDAVDGLFLGRFGHDPDTFLRTAKELAEV